MESIWEREVDFPARKVLIGDIKTQVAIIGGGLCGVLTTFFLNRMGISTVLLEAKTIGSGQTGHTTAKVTSQHNVIYSRIAREWGFEKAKQYADANQWAIQEYRQLILDRNIDCDWRDQTACLYTFRNRAALEQEAKAASRLGIKSWVDTRNPRTGKPDGFYPTVLRFENQGSFQPLSFLKNISADLEIYENTRAIKVEGRRIITPHGSVTADHIVFATHFPFMNRPGYYFMRMHQERSYVLALKNTSLLNTMYLGIDPEGISLRSYKDMVLLGGSGHRTGEATGIRHYEYLKKRAKEIWPHCQISALWSAQDCMTLDGIPYIGTFARSKPNWHVATGFGKWGMTSSMAAARILSAQIAGISTPWAPVFSPERALTSSAKKAFASEGIHAVSGLARGFFGGIRCQHLGCRLKWNRDEHSWECPCHGSRFDMHGKLLDNPAQEDLSNG